MTLNTFTSGTDAKAEEVNDNFLEVENRTKSDQTDGSATNTTTETEIGEVLVSANEVATGVVVIATGNFFASFDAPHTEVRLRTGTSNTATSNTVRKTIEREVRNQKTGWTLVYVLTSEENWTTDTYIHITAENSYASATCSCTCESVVVMNIGAAL